MTPLCFWFTTTSRKVNSNFKSEQTSTHKQFGTSRKDHLDAASRCNGSIAFGKTDHRDDRPACRVRFSVMHDPKSRKKLNLAACLHLLSFSLSARALFSGSEFVLRAAFVSSGELSQ